VALVSILKNFEKFLRPRDLLAVVQRARIECSRAANSGAHASERPHCLAVLSINASALVRRRSG
jgi:hypothetical protein